MTRILLPVDGSASSDRAVMYLVRRSQAGIFQEIHLLHVPLPAVSGTARLFAGHDAVDVLSVDEVWHATRSARSLLDKAGVKYTTHIAHGPIAETIASFAKRRRCNLIVMGTRGMGPVRNLLLGSVATRVIELIDVPVTLIK